jgi:hypothetical protein
MARQLKKGPRQDISLGVTNIINGISAEKDTRDEHLCPAQLRGAAVFGVQLERL